MKNVCTWLKITLFLFVLIVGCKGNDDDPKSDLQSSIDKLSHSWKVNTVSSNVPDDESLYSTIVITFVQNNGSLTYTMSNPDNAKNPPAKASSGIWKFNDDLTAVILDPETQSEMTLKSIFLSSASISFSIDGQGIKKTNAITVDYTLVPNK